MALSTSDYEPRRTALYADLTVQWARQTVAYSRSVRLYQEQLSRLRRRREQALVHAARPELTARRAARLVAIVDAPTVEVGEPAPGQTAVPTSAESARPGATSRGPFTRRQREIAELIAQGLTNGQIAARIVVSRGTVGNHIGHMLRRLGVNNRAQIAAWVIRRSQEE
jgi:DNA-binding CsgD family transcriptional regulator